MNRLAIRSFYAWIPLAALLLAVACGGGSTPAGTALTPEQRAQQQAQLDQRLLQLQAQVTQLNQQLAELRLDQQQRLEQAIQQGTALSAQIIAIQQELQSSAGSRPAGEMAAPKRVIPTGTSTGEPAKITHADSADHNGHWRIFVRFLVAVILIGAVFFIIKIFFGRWGEDEETDELLNEHDEFAAADATDEDTAEDEMAEDELARAEDAPREVTPVDIPEEIAPAEQPPTPPKPDDDDEARG